MKPRFVQRVACAALALLIPATSVALLNVPSNGSNGALTMSANKTIDLAAAVKAPWDSVGAGNSGDIGIYDPEKWAIVFHYTDVNITAGTLTFTNHPSGAPVVWLVQGNVTINGTVSLNAMRGHRQEEPMSNAEPGPGGFRGGRGGSGSTAAGSGFGPGGANLAMSGGSYGTLGGNAPGLRYGNTEIVPLVGGSGGSGRNWPAGGGAGGGGILIVAGGDLTIGTNGQIQALGGDGGFPGGGGGSGGAIRLLVNTAAGSGRLRAYAGAGNQGSGSGGDGRIRVEANQIALTDLGLPAFTTGVPTNPLRIWPDASDPVARIVSLNGDPVRPDPHGEFSFPDQDVTITNDDSLTVIIETQNVPVNWTVDVRLTPQVGGASTETSSATVAKARPIGGNHILSTWIAVFDNVLVRSGFSAVQARAHAPGS